MAVIVVAATVPPDKFVAVVAVAAFPVVEPLHPVVLWFSVGNVQLVKVPELGVPNAPPLVTNEPAVPTAIANADATLVPRPLMPVEIGRPVQEVNVPLDGVPKAGATKACPEGKV